MEFSKNMTQHLTSLLINTSENIALGIKYGMTTMPEVEEALAEWHTFCEELAKEWPSDRIRDFIVEEHRNRYRAVVAFMEKLELQNRDDRAKGMSYKDRQASLQRLEMASRTLETLKVEGSTAKTLKYDVRQFLDPISITFVKERGFEARLHFCT